ncbi:Protein CBR-PAX-3 [Caenorhabditis briggsae]|uniref:Protein CBR-PAX-3 n=1 Tax=Caenorhabditis briggsae TaxID=6238 RepID=A8WPF9_CAEBR|nr:Protein CBR-PAX-3 [Caenorhabditis briggsae]CAP22366.3 Protein CBR-PAX-3 [Caenorhabditis briggsae]
MTTDSITFNHILGQGRVNQLGGVFINGRPLPIHVRHAIIAMAKKGVKPCHISRQLKVSHGAVSKILNRYAETGSISPGQIGGSPRARLTVHAVEKEIIIAHEENPHLSAAELRDVLVQKDVCTKGNAPTVPAIKRLIGKKMERKRLSYSIDSILGISIGGSFFHREPFYYGGPFYFSKPLSEGSSIREAFDDDCSKSSSDDEDTNDTSSASSSSARRNRTSFSAEQLDVLETSFRASTYPDAQAKEHIAKETGLSEEKIMTWFSNRRARCRKNMPIYHQYNTAHGFNGPQTYPALLPSPMMFLPGYGTSPQLNPLFFQNILQTSPSSTQSSPPSS